MNRLYKRSEVDMISCHMLTHVCLGDEVDDSCYPRYDFFCLKNCIRIVYVGLTVLRYVADLAIANLTSSSLVSDRYSNIWLSSFLFFLIHLCIDSSFATISSICEFNIEQNLGGNS